MRLAVAGGVLALAVVAAGVGDPILAGSAPGPSAGVPAHRLDPTGGDTPVPGIETHMSGPAFRDPPAPRATAAGPVLEPGGSFFDDDGDLHEGAIEAIAAAGVTRGCGADLFCPDRAVTRGEMAAFLRRALGLEASAVDHFSDDGASIFAGDIDAVAAAGVTRGCGADLFCPDRAVTRGEMAAFLRRALGLEASAVDHFSDDGASIFAGDIDAIAAAGITRGCNPPANDAYCPDDPVTRAQMASFLARALGLPPLVPPPRPSVTLAFTGDVLIHAPVWRAAVVDGGFDFRPMFDRVAPVIADADLALCHLEVPLSATNRDLSGYPLFNAPREVADALAWSGYDGCSTASNHSFDQGVRGVHETLDVLGDAGLRWAGTAVHPEATGATEYRVGDVTVAHLSATWWLNGLRLPAGSPWLVQMLDVGELTARAAAAREAGADIVVVSMHCCTEYVREPTPYQRETARTLIASPHIDLVVGHHAHVVQPIEPVGDEVIVYGLGNFLSAQRRLPATRDGVVVLTEFAARGDGWSVREVGAVPTRVEGGTYQIVPAEAGTPSWRRTMGALESEGYQVEPAG